jgi:hypothetical protein
MLAFAIFRTVLTVLPAPRPCPDQLSGLDWTASFRNERITCLLLPISPNDLYKMLFLNSSLYHKQLYLTIDPLNGTLPRSAEAMSLGDLAGPQFWKRYHDLPKVALQLGIFAPGEKKFSSYRQCRDCPYCAECFICPVSAGYLPGNDRCERVPDFTCAFNFTAFKYRERFLEKIL